MPLETIIVVIFASKDLQLLYCVCLSNLENN